MNAKEDILNNGMLEGLKDYTTFKKRANKYVKPNTKKTRTLNQWYIKLILNGNKNIKSKYWICVCGYLKDGSQIQSSIIVDSEGPRTVITDNTIYLLGTACNVGTNKPFRIFREETLMKFSGGFPKDWKTLIFDEVNWIIKNEKLEEEILKGRQKVEHIPVYEPPVNERIPTRDLPGQTPSYCSDSEAEANLYRAPSGAKSQINDEKEDLNDLNNLNKKENILDEKIKNSLAKPRVLSKQEKEKQLKLIQEFDDILTAKRSVKKAKNRTVGEFLQNTPFSKGKSKRLSIHNKSIETSEIKKETKEEEMDSIINWINENETEEKTELDSCTVKSTDKSFNKVVEEVNEIANEKVNVVEESIEELNVVEEAANEKVNEAEEVIINDKIITNNINEEKTVKSQHNENSITLLDNQIEKLETNSCTSTKKTPIKNTAINSSSVITPQKRRKSSLSSLISNASVNSINTENSVNLSLLNESNENVNLFKFQNDQSEGDTEQNSMESFLIEEEEGRPARYSLPFDTKNENELLDLIQNKNSMTKEDTGDVNADSEELKTQENINEKTSFVKTNASSSPVAPQQHKKKRPSLSVPKSFSLAKKIFKSKFMSKSGRNINSPNDE